jgi:hypothetical protein
LTLNFLMLTAPRVFLTVDLAAAPLMALGFLWAAPNYGAIGVAFVSMSFRLIKTAVIQTGAYRLARRHGPLAVEPALAADA